MTMRVYSNKLGTDIYLHFCSCEDLVTPLTTLHCQTRFFFAFRSFVLVKPRGSPVIGQLPVPLSLLQTFCWDFSSFPNFFLLCFHFLFHFLSVLQKSFANFLFLIDLEFQHCILACCARHRPFRIIAQLLITLMLENTTFRKG